MSNLQILNSACNSADRFGDRLVVPMSMVEPMAVKLDMLECDMGQLKKMVKLFYNGISEIEGWGECSNLIPIMNEAEKLLESEAKDE